MGRGNQTLSSSASLVIAVGASAALVYTVLLRRRLRIAEKYVKQLQAELLLAKAEAEAERLPSEPASSSSRTPPPSPLPSTLPQDRLGRASTPNRSILSQQSSLDASFGQQGLLAKHIEVGKFLGEGSFGAVHRGRWRGVPVALKFLKGGGGRDLVKILSREGKVLNEIDHPNVMRLYGVCCADRDGDGAEEGALPPSWTERQVRPPVLVCELLPGGNFVEFLLATAEQRAEKARHWRRVAKMLEGAATGLEYIHERGVVHRDIKALNLFVDGRGRLKLGDFGLAKMGNDSLLVGPGGGGGRTLLPSKLIRVRSTGSTGTWTHQAPELMRDNGNGPVTYTPAVDIFAFAIVIVEALGANVAEELIDGTRKVVPGRAKGEPLVFGIDVDGVRSLLREGWHCPETNALIGIVEECGSIDPARRPRATKVRADLSRVRLAPMHLELQLKTRSTQSTSATSSGGSRVARRNLGSSVASSISSAGGHVKGKSLL
mmetsp:Transcript_21148/g.61509  ORF Transcript_21148/g.61509 Transcript_21148/m.61509 type:complete len:489 (-) Transcript_21148:1159-2625(-)